MQIAQQTITLIVFWNLIIVCSTGFPVFQFSDQKKGCVIFIRKIQFMMKYRNLILVSIVLSGSHEAKIQLMLYIIYIVS